jgi:hypothetical protein
MIEQANMASNTVDLLSESRAVLYGEMEDQQTGSQVKSNRPENPYIQS